MRNIFTFLILLLFSLQLFAQINPLVSPYSQPGPYTVVMDSNMTTSPDILIFRPSTSTNAPYPTVLFQPGANSSTTYITKHSYDIYWQHLASYGYVVIIMNNTSGGPNGTLFTNMHDYIKQEVASGTSWMSNYVDLNRFIVSGHSNGGMNATDIIINRPDEIDAIVYMASYPNPGIFGMGAQNVANYTGKVLLMCGSEDQTSVTFVGTTNAVAKTAYDSRFTSCDCKNWVLFNGIGHGGFGDYNNPSQPVGSIGRDSTTASIRHMLVSFLNSYFKSDGTAYTNFSSSSLRPSPVSEYETTCPLVTNIEYTFQNKEINVYPNPSNDILNIELEDNKYKKIEIYNILAEKIYESDIYDSNMAINVKEFNTGIYWIRISGENNKQLVKFIKN